MSDTPVLDNLAEITAASVNHGSLAARAMSDTPVLDNLAEITAASVNHGSLAAREHMLTRLAALVAVDAPAASYLLNFGVAVDVGVTLEDVQGVLVAVAPIVGTARVASAAGNITEALGFVVAIAEAEADAELADEGIEKV